MGKKRSINLIIGPLLFVLFSVLLPSSVFSTFAARSAIGTVAWMAYWWVTGPIDYAVTAFLPIALNALFQMTDMSSVIANYASETILLLLGASIPAPIRHLDSIRISVYNIPPCLRNLTSFEIREYILVKIPDVIVI